MKVDENTWRWGARASMDGRGGEPSAPGSIRGRESEISHLSAAVHSRRVSKGVRAVRDRIVLRRLLCDELCYMRLVHTDHRLDCHDPRVNGNASHVRRRGERKRRVLTQDDARPCGSGSEARKRAWMLRVPKLLSDGTKRLHLARNAKRTKRVMIGKGGRRAPPALRSAPPHARHASSMIRRSKGAAGHEGGARDGGDAMSKR